ncbi:MAG: cell division protein ZapA [Gammaproteobacteria bacterium]|nr:cell division protein ZapA [Gammaproteobacteria bacterium]MCY4210803.1 cell division protein ZapA [Gammaproteobacteria bacterium]MCY4281619.1 cell division protein ZapA [Gammaproteobacteria bacterium]MCY4337789.1 cell division protein ZapA [Gammaproteobacteria bacterium]
MTQAKPVRVSILDKEYLISCTDDEREQLHSVVEFLNEKLLEVKNSGKVIGTERVVVMAALNIANELLAYKQKNKHYTESVDSMVKRLQAKIDDVLVEED